MKKWIAVISILFIVTGTAIAGIDIVAQSSGEKTVDFAALAGPGYLTAVEVITDGTNDAKVILYDHATAASGKVIFEATITGASHYGGRVFVPPVEVYNGVYADVSGTGASYIVETVAR